MAAGLSRTVVSRQGLTDLYRADAAGVSDSHPSTPSNSQAEPRADLPGSGAEPVNQHPVTQAPVAHPEGLLASLVHDGPDDAGAGEDDLGALGLQPDDPAASQERYSFV